MTTAAAPEESGYNPREFHKYMHVERLGTREVSGILDGVCHVFPKLDGTNAQVWCEDSFLCQPQVGAGSRRRVLSEDDDNHGFCKWVYQQDNLFAFFQDYPGYRLYGEWLVPHNLRTYREDAWRRFYVFDVMDPEGDLLPYEVYNKQLESYGIDYVAPLRVIKNPTEEDIHKCLQENTELIEEGQGIGEGVVVKNYGFRNEFGRQTWAKVVSNEFKEKHRRKEGPPVSKGSGPDTEWKIVERFVTEAFVRKELAKLSPPEEPWDPKLIPQLLGRIYYTLIKEESWEFVKIFKNPTINYKKLQGFVNSKIKEHLTELF